MPYFVFKINEGPTALIKNLEMVQEFEVFKDAKNHARELRTEEEANFKVIFADNALEAEERLQEQREKPILMEWEK
jgi:hypothetical protein